MLIHSVVLTVYNAPFDVDLCLRSLASSLDFLQVELILVDDASKQETQKILDDFIAQYPQAVLVRHAENKGYLHSVNDGIRHAHGDIITLLNSDTFIPAGFSDRILACFGSSGQIGVASPVLSHGNPFSVPIAKRMKQEFNSGTFFPMGHVFPYAAAVWKKSEILRKNTVRAILKSWIFACVPIKTVFAVFLSKIFMFIINLMRLSEKRGRVNTWLGIKNVFMMIGGGNISG